jgi:hypothetical protein
MPSRRIALIALAAGLSAVEQPIASAQVLSPRPRREAKWTAEVYAGAVMSPTPTGGDAAPFPTGSTFRTEPGAPSRANASWYFGDGAALFNEVNAQFASRFNRRFPQLAPLDAMLTSAALGRRGAGNFGVRATRRLTKRFGVEVSFDGSRERLQVTSAAKEAIEAARASFERGFSGLLATLPQTRLQVISTAEIDDASSTRQRMIAGALTIALTKHRRLATHALVGGGRLFGRADAIDARLRGNYQFRFIDTFPIDETDTVTIRFTDRGTGAVGVFGGGVTSDFGGRHGVRADVRLIVGGSGISTSIDASASAQRTAPFVALPSNTSPSLQFSTIAGDRSSLTGSIAGLNTFIGSGFDTRILLTVGYFVRF